MLKGPGKYLVLMTWWILVCFVIQLYSYPVASYLSSYLIYLIAFIFTICGAALLNLLESRFELWSHRGLCGKLILLTIAYTATIGANLIAIMIFDSLNYHLRYGLDLYFGGDAGGSFGLLYVPSIVIYWGIGMVVCTVVSVFGRLKKRHRTNK
jgi:hypothetical protein